MKERYQVIGLMSGTSLDGLDIAHCEFDYSNNEWKFKLIQSETVSYDNHWREMLGEIHKKSAEEITAADCAYGDFLGQQVKVFCDKHKLVPDFISSHGHTIFHQPEKGYTKQIGSGAHLAAITGSTVICDFRSVDVALGGQGAPLVPIGDKYLFKDAGYCLNLGGIANISFDKNHVRIAFDICACNLVLNYYAQKKGLSYDENGNLASAGVIVSELLLALNNHSYYKKDYPKSLGREDVERDLIPLIDKFKCRIEDILATFCEHIAFQISNSILDEGTKRGMLITGGGTLNKFLVNRISENSRVQVIIPERKIIEYKEAIIFAFLGVLRIRNEINCLKSVTGARIDNCGGAIYLTH